MRSALLCICLLALGCSAVVNPDDSLLGDPPADGGVGTDSGIRLMDSGPRPDASPPPDGSPPPPPEDGGPPPPPEDAGPVMCDGPDRCDGDVLVTCSGGFEERFDCAGVDAFCEGAECNDRNCEPGASRCTSGGFASFVCDERGVGEERVGCARGCDFSTGRCRGDDPPPETCTDIETISVGSDDEVDLCDRGNGTSYVGGGDCRGDSDADSGEQVYSLTITEPTNVEIEAYDVDEGSAVDTVVYIRRTCDAPDSQVACADDVPCALSDFPGGPRCVGGEGGVEVRQSILRTRLEPGTYFVIVDAHEYASGGVRYTCGDVRVEVREADGG